MSVDSMSELQSFHQFLAKQLETGNLSLSPEEALDMWRVEHPSRELYEEDVQAIREALNEMKAGDTGTAADEFLAEFSRRHKLTAPKDGR